MAPLDAIIAAAGKIAETLRNHMPKNVTETTIYSNRLPMQTNLHVSNSPLAHRQQQRCNRNQHIQGYRKRQTVQQQTRVQTSRVENVPPEEEEQECKLLRVQR